MKKTLLIITLFTSVVLIPVPRTHAQIPVIGVIKQVLAKVIKAIDLEIQRQQNKVIWLQNAQKALENSMSKLKLDEISGWVEKQRQIYDSYFQELRKVKDAIASYSRIKDILQKQKQLLDEYGRTWALLKQDTHFTPQELDQMSRIYSGILNESLKNIEELELVATSFKMQMSDADRMALLRKISDRQDQHLSDLRRFNNQNKQLSLSRAKDQKEAAMLKQWYGL